MNHVGIPKFDAKNELQLQLAQHSIELRELVEKNIPTDTPLLDTNNFQNKIAQLEQEVDDLVNKLFGMK